MIHTQTEIESPGMNISARHDTEDARQVQVVWLMTLLAIAMTIAAHSVMAQAKKPSLPYVTIDHPQFISASQATFLSPHNLLIGVSDGKTAKAYPAAILAQHGVVQDRMADGPIAVTW
jgi:hypothetical protein